MDVGTGGCNVLYDFKIGQYLYPVLLMLNVVFQLKLDNFSQ